MAGFGDLGKGLMMQPQKLIFLPGAGGNPAFWRPVAERIDHPVEKRLFGWPGFGDVPARPDVNGIDDLVSMVLAEIDRPCALIAQSMGGVVAVRAALEKTGLVTHLVLTATSGGIDISGTGAEDWRPSFFASNPGFPRWFESYREDLTPRIKELPMPTLLLWGNNDPISPVAAGERLNTLLRNAHLHVIEGGEHDLANKHAEHVAPLIARHLGLAA
jgi:pimeloyl-ACP methyl ester carboxylesterase